ncbi:PEST proteolytic signal-containing nuclear protein-like [Elysia marginata]|uniref:PEST proteolytic signal-containing nuclear protein n=1 Tax=Elysia marginata TaxID=1093978 RepID=A0AAV4ER86_9GAST|nr:PEST proteolytic signal-containing nuclear protein-like [Elysia marginata]
MADSASGTDSEPREDGEIKSRSAEKRQSSKGVEEASAPKKISISLGPKPSAGLNQKISFNLGGASKAKPSLPTGKPDQAKGSVMPIKMSLGSSVQKSKEPPPVVQKSALAAKVFNDDDDSDDEEMPPEAKMRMKNIGRNTPTASGPNSYGKGKFGFIDRQKIIEKQIKEEMDKVSGDKK